METKTKMYRVISLDKNNTTMRFVQLTYVQIRKLFRKEVINVLSQERYLFLPVDGKVGRFSIVRMKIGDTYCLVLKLSSREFTKLFPEGNYKIFTKKVGESQKKDETCFRENPVSVPASKPQPKMVVVHSSPNRKSTKTKVIPFPNYYAFNYDYSMVFYNHRNLSSFYIMSDVG